MIQQHGFKGLYRGLNITLLEIIPYAALQFGLYDTFTAAWSKTRRAQLSSKVMLVAVHLAQCVQGNAEVTSGIDSNGISQGRDLHARDGHSSFERFICGLCAGTLAKLTTHPLDVAKKRFQIAGLPRDARSDMLVIV